MSADPVAGEIDYQAAPPAKRAADPPRHAHVAFWTLLIVGAWSEDLRPRAVATFLILWLSGLFGLPYILPAPYGAGLFISYVAVLDVVLVFIVLKTDVWLT